MEDYKKESEMNEDKEIVEVEAIEEEARKTIANETDINRLIEEPLRGAVRSLIEKGIETFASSANKKDLDKGFASIILNYENLSETNRKVVTDLEKEKLSEQIEFKDTQATEIKVPLSSSSTVTEIREKSKDIVERFKEQKADWIQEYRIEDLIKFYYIKDESEISQAYKNPQKTFEQFYFDTNTQKFYEDEWLAKIKKKLKKE